MAETKHDIWEKCGHPNILDAIPKPTEPFQRTRITAREFADSRCACCGGELVILIGYNIIAPNGVDGFITCPICYAAKLKEIEQT